ncbi:MAG: DUF2807 domain-containing protein [Bacteroidales bacterium]|nr:DUF2807 domain-containing protein [Bacteroidales bacterium]
MKVLIYVLAVAMLCISCDNENLPDFMKSEGAIVSDTVAIQPYKELIINNNCLVSLVKDSRDFIVVEYGENLISNVHVDYDEASARVSVSDDTKFRMVRNNSAVPKIKCHFSLLCNILANACVIISSDDNVDVREYVFNGFAGGLNIVSNAPEVKLEITDGTGTYKMSGKADCLDIDVSYTSIVDALGLRARVAKVVNNSTGDVRVNATDTVYAEIRHTGDICYKSGAVPVQKVRKGKGSLRVIED